ncbi:efflux RND transporter periplasmic adaptor subunit [Clostridium sp. CX1]|uniref:efflux RND transporter periplasmic adaptor subunit n=1 Tax=Clostridium sp. CX1 TaxID=2978346 RepID=UPI0021C08938|nr:efflux RND transporter periplasmic adaptor subunit [Clostridium sp. CX1]MCT8978628.1 efflux RND transporter periplasmic adaptor subunit [Clostridium sp. CX1]
MKKTALFCLVTAILLTGCGASGVTSTKDNKQTTKSIQQNNSNQFIMGGKIAANTQADITSKISARISEITVDIGSKVNQGDVIIKLDTQDLQAQVEQAQAAVNTARASLANAQNSVRPEQVASAQATLDSAAENYAVIKKNYDRIKALVDTGAAAQQQLDTAQQQLAAAEAQQKNAQEQLNMLNNGPTRSSIEVYQAQVSQAEAALKVAQTALNNGTIVSPISGTVSAKNINVGELAGAGAKLLSIVNSEALCVNAYAPLEIINDLKEGQDVVIKVSELPDKEFTGKITVINSKLNDQSRNILVKVSIEDPKALLKPGMFAQIGLKK